MFIKITTEKVPEIDNTPIVYQERVKYKGGDWKIQQTLKGTMNHWFMIGGNYKKNIVRYGNQKFIKI